MVRALVFFLGFVLVSCQSDVLYHHYEHVYENGWSQLDTLRFALPPAPHDGTYALQMGVRYTPDFPYCDVSAVIDYGTGASDTLLIPFASADGKPLGRGVSLLHKTLPLPPLYLHEGQQPTISLHHIMRREVLPSIREIGIRVEEE